MIKKPCSCYLCVKDMDRAINFYEDWLGRQTTVDPVFSVIDIDGFRLCLFNPQKVGEPVTYGDNCLLSFEVDDLKKELERLKGMGREIVYPLKQIGKSYVAEFKDTEGNDIEIFQPIV